MIYMEKSMKLLIVDDEELTRTGVIASVDWNSLGITEVIQADDGVHGLEMARLHQPEIILCDVRMPRMDGITMLERMEKFLPDMVPIFMSGYSDKEYLKAAIKLKAVNYIEKPLKPSEIEAAVQEARDLYIQKQHSHRGETLHSMETASSLALQLTLPYTTNATSIEKLAGELQLQLGNTTWFTSYIVKTDTSLESTTTSLGDFCQDFQSFMSGYHTNCIYIEKKSRYLVYFLISQTRPLSNALTAAGNYLKDYFSGYGKFIMAQGDVLCGLSRAYQSYSSAVILLQSGFFFAPGTLLTSELIQASPGGTSEIFSGSVEKAFSDTLSRGDQEEAARILEQLFNAFYQNHRYLQNPVKDLYYRLFLCIEEAYRQQKITGTGTKDSIAETIENCFSFQDLHQILSEKAADFFREAATSAEENPTIFMIKEYIGKNYMNETLSVKDISSHVFLSASYVCTFFKNETGQTLNQYLTEFRMEKAKQLLRDARYKISDISSRVGYSDGNYFGKSFKKYSGLSPSEYREKNLQ